MNVQQVKLIYEVARILNQPRKEYLARVKDFNTSEEEIGPFHPIALVDIESTLVHSQIHLRVADILFNNKKFIASPLHDAIVSTHINVVYNGATVFTMGKWTMIGIIVTNDWFKSNGTIAYSGIYLIDETRIFGFFKLDEFLKK